MENYSKKALFDILAITGSIVTITLAFFPSTFTCLIDNYHKSTIGAILTIIILTYFYITQKKCFINLKVNETTKLNISYGNLFDKKISPNASLKRFNAREGLTIEKTEDILIIIHPILLR